MKKMISIDAEEFEFVFAIEIPYDRKVFRKDMETALASAVGEEGFNLLKCSLKPTKAQKLR